MQFFKINFRTDVLSEQAYLYKDYQNLFSFGNVEIKIVVKQNCDPKTNKFFNTIKEAFIKLENYNFDLWQRALPQNVYKNLFEIFDKDIYFLEKFFAVLDTRKVATENNFDLYFFYNDNL